MAEDPKHRALPQSDPPNDQGQSTKTFSIKMASWLTDLAPEGGEPGRVEIDIEAIPAAPVVAAPPPPDTASPFASRPYHRFEAPGFGAAPDARAPVPASVRDGGSGLASVPGIASSSPIPAPAPSSPTLAASAVPPIPGLAGGARDDAPCSTGLLVGVGIVVALVVAGGAGWFFWSEPIRALLKI